MTCEVVVVGAGLGGLTVAALLAARGVSVCVLERESYAGGCAAPFDHSGFRFEGGAGLYAGWQPDGIHARVFAELPVPLPEVRRLAPAYVVRLPDGTDVRVGLADVAEFEMELRHHFPECAAAAVAFYREIGPIAEALRRSARRFPALATASKLQRLRLSAMEARTASRVLALEDKTAAALLSPGLSPRFHRFIDAQLHLFAGRPAAECAALYAAIALTEPQRGLYAISGGAVSLIDALTRSIINSGGTIRFDAPALRLADDDAGGRIAGVDLLSGERLTATRAIVSNLTIWDTYGKLVGLNRTPAAVRARLKSLRGRGAYVLYLALDEAAARRLPADQVLAVHDWQENQTDDPVAGAQLMFSATPAWDQSRAAVGQRAVTVSCLTDAEQWFSFHEDESEHEAQDQLALGKYWGRLHATLPELGAGVEVIETATPRTFYERTRRKLGMIGGVGQSLDVFGTNAVTHRTPLPNFYMVGDTVFPGNGVAAVTHSALIVADEIASPR